MLPTRMFDTICQAPDAGYSSVYMFDQDSAREILDARSSAGLDRFSVYTDELVIDLDGGDAQLKRAQETLARFGLYYEVWNSGGKGYHIVIRLTELIGGNNVPYSQRKWVEALNIGADLSLYQHGRIISLPGRKHPKTGKRKALVSTIKGNLLTLPLLDPPAPVFASSLGEGGELEAGLWRVLGLIQAEPEPGNRHTALWSTAKHFADAGIEYDTTLDILTAVNEQWENQKTAEEVAQAVGQAFQR